MTRYITVRLTEHEADCLLTMAASGDYQADDSEPEVKRASNRAERKIRRALIESRSKTEEPNAD